MKFPSPNKDAVFTEDERCPTKIQPRVTTKGQLTATDPFMLP